MFETQTILFITNFQSVKCVTYSLLFKGDIDSLFWQALSIRYEQNNSLHRMKAAIVEYILLNICMQ